MTADMQTSRNAIDLGVPGESVGGLVQLLCVVLADEAVLRAKLQNYHWNVTGPNFRALHLTFEDQYNALAAVIDEVAERIRTFGAKTPGTLTEFLQQSRVKEQPGEYPDARTMVANAVADHETMVRNLRNDIEAVDDEYDEVGVEDMLTGLLQQHQTMAWMLRALLEGPGL
jgi:starvation-inducible DNA-binding protein